MAFNGNAVYRSCLVTKIYEYLNCLCVSLDRDLVVFFDDADSLKPQVTASFLSQIRAGYMARFQSFKPKFPGSIGLVGTRDIRGCFAEIRPEGRPDADGIDVHFNIAVDKSLTLQDFTRNEIGLLHRQHTEDTGQAFEESAVDRAWFWTGGQPWLVSAVARDIIEDQLNGDCSGPVSETNVDTASFSIISDRYAHLEYLKGWMRDPGIFTAMKTVAFGSEPDTPAIPEADVRLASELVLIKPDPDARTGYRIANPIYQEVFVRHLTAPIQDIVPAGILNRRTDGSSSDVSSLLSGFQAFLREYSEIFRLRSSIVQRMKNAASKFLRNLLPAGRGGSGAADATAEIKERLACIPAETTARLILYAYLQRATTGSAGDVLWEYRPGYFGTGIRLRYNGILYPLELAAKGESGTGHGKERLCNSMDRCGSSEGWLVVFDIGSGRPWDARLTWDTETYRGKTVHVVGC